MLYVVSLDGCLLLACNDGPYLTPYLRPHAHPRPRDASGTRPEFHLITNNKVWLAQWGLSHWGQRVKVVGWEAHDCSRGANIFGVAQLSNALINGRSANQWARWGGGGWVGLGKAGCVSAFGAGWVRLIMVLTGTKARQADRLACTFGIAIHFCHAHFQHRLPMITLPHNHHNATGTPSVCGTWTPLQASVGTTPAS